MSQLNMEAVAASAASELAKDFVTGTIDRVSGKSRELFQRYFPQFEKHLSGVYQRNSRVKIIVNRDAPVAFQEIYVPSKFKSSSNILSDNEICDQIVSGEKLIVSAIGGAGKTFLLRHTWLRIFSEKSGKVPIFLELRKVNSSTSLALESFIRADAFGPDFTIANFEHFGEDGTFVFLLDGFDEVNREKRSDLETQIIALSKKYPKCGFLISGRPDDRFGGWQEFTSVKALPFDFDQFCDLLKKIPFDLQIKSNFMKIADLAFFNQHESFLSNPLLSMMMLLTYRDNAEIPSKLSTFYDNCFATLFSQHDALKESFRREKCLDQLEFKRVFAIFCLLSYRDNRHSLEEGEFLSYVQRAKDYLKLKQEPSAIAHDFLESVNLAIKEGTNISFIHRSFQEYFSAVAVTSVLPDGIGEMLSLFASRMADKSFKLAFELHPGLVTREFIVPNYRKLTASGAIFKRRDSTRPFRACAAAGIAVVFDTEVSPRHRRKGGKIPPSQPSVSRFVKRLSLNLDNDVDTFLFCCDEAFLDSREYGAFRGILFELFDAGFGLILRPNRAQEQALSAGDWRFTISFVELDLVMKSRFSDDAEMVFPGEFSRAGMDRISRVANRLEAALSAYMKRACAAVEDMMALQAANKFVFVRG